jgi:hypothetical protein
MPELNQQIVLRETVVPRVDTDGSVESTSQGVSLTNDEDNPGANQVYGTNSDGDKVWKNDEKTIAVITKTESHTLTLSDVGKIILMNSASANTLTVPSNSSVAFNIGSSILVAQYGSGQTTIVADEGVTIRSQDDNLLITAQYAGVSLIKIGTNEWLAVGNLS